MPPVQAFPPEGVPTLSYTPAQQQIADWIVSHQFDVEAAVRSDGWPTVDGLSRSKVSAALDILRVCPSPSAWRAVFWAAGFNDTVAAIAELGEQGTPWVQTLGGAAPAIVADSARAFGSEAWYRLEKVADRVPAMLRESQALEEETAALLVEYSGAASQGGHAVVRSSLTRMRQSLGWLTRPEWQEARRTAHQAIELSFRVARQNPTWLKPEDRATLVHDALRTYRYPSQEPGQEPAWTLLALSAAMPTGEQFAPSMLSDAWWQENVPVLVQMPAWFEALPGAQRQLLARLSDGAVAAMLRFVVGYCTGNANRWMHAHVRARWTEVVAEGARRRLIDAATWAAIFGAAQGEWRVIGIEAMGGQAAPRPARAPR